jgi:hypothetical protein
MNTISQLHNSVQSGNTSDTYAISTEPGLTAENPKFQELLQVMMFSSQLSEMQGSSDSGQGSIFNSNLFMPLMIGLMEQLFQMEMDSAADLTPLDLAKRIHINQFSAEREQGDTGPNANCGPASLAMAMRAAGVVPEVSNGNLVDFARRAMVSDASRDGVDNNGLRVDWEHNSYTSLAEISRGAETTGFHTRRISADSSSILQALRGGAQVIISGTFRNKSPLPWTGDTSNDYLSSPGGATEHFVLVSGYDERTGKVIINDPARQSPLTAYPSVLDYFMQGNDGALALHR